MKALDTDLWAGLLLGNELSFREIYLAHQDALFKYAMRMLSDEDAARDCLHNLFVKVWMNRKNLSATNNIRYYLMSSLRNEILNYRQKEQRAVQGSERYAETFDMLFSPESDYISREESRAQAQKLAVAMNQLTPRQKEIIYLRYFEDLSYEQIAEMMDINVKGAYKLSARALEALREVLSVDKAGVVFMILSLKNYF